MPGVGAAHSVRELAGLEHLVASASLEEDPSWPVVSYGEKANGGEDPQAAGREPG